MVAVILFRGAAVASAASFKSYIPTSLIWGAPGLISILIAFAIALLAPLMAPIKRGTAEELWEQACHFRPSEQSIGGRGQVFKPREGWFVYDLQYMHHSDVYRVPESEVFASLNEVVAKLRNGENPYIYPYANAGCEKWFNRPDPSRHDAQNLLADIREAQLDHWRTKNPHWCYMLESEEWLAELRWAQGKWYWFNIVFEWLFLSGLVLFAAWPVRRDKVDWRRVACHWGILPLLFMMPAYLGYASLSFSSRGPCGGILYPWLIFGLRHSAECNDFDRQILVHTPQILEPLSAEIPIPLMGNMNDIIWSAMPGPTTMVIAGLLIALLVFSVHKLRDRLQQNAAIARKRIGPSPLPEDQ
jgi:hypothetical protein